jgi:acetyl esterase
MLLESRISHQVASSLAAPELDFEAAELIRRLSGTISLASLTAQAARRSYAESRLSLTWSLEEVAAVKDIDRLGPGVPALRLIRPKAAAELTFIYLHGGGWTLGGLDVYEPLLRRLANRLRANLIWVEYALAPEHPFPAPLQDTLAACRAIFRNASKLGLDETKIGIMGDSAGGNLAAVAALMNRYGQLGHRFASQVLLYPCLDLTASLPSHRELAAGYLLTAEIYGWYRNNYLQGINPTDWQLSPLFVSDVGGLPPTIILRAGFDPLRDEALAYGVRLRAAGVSLQEISFPGMIHGFLNMGGVLPQAGQAVDELAGIIRALPQSRYGLNRRSA